MSDFTQIVSEALHVSATHVYVVPESMQTFIRFRLRDGSIRDHQKVGNRTGQSVVDQAKRLCGMPVTRDRDLSGSTTVFANNRRISVRVTTKPYRDSFERAEFSLGKS